MLSLRLVAGASAAVLGSIALSTPSAVAFWGGGKNGAVKMGAIKWENVKLSRSLGRLWLKGDATNTSNKQLPWEKTASQAAKLCNMWVQTQFIDDQGREWNATCDSPPLDPKQAKKNQILARTTSNVPEDIKCIHFKVNGWGKGKKYCL